MTQLGMTLQPLSNGLQNCYPYADWYCPSPPPINHYHYSFRPYEAEQLKLGQFDLFLDRCGNLRIIRDGVLVGQFDKVEKK